MNKILAVTVAVLIAGNVAFGVYQTRQLPIEIERYVKAHNVELKGEQGIQGIAGPQGPTGAVGASGKSGKAGSSGATGNAGAAGQNGMNGCTWVDGYGWYCP